MRFKTDKFEVLMLMMTALCCSVALVSCGKTAKSRDAEKHAQEVADQLRAQDAEKARQTQAQAQAQAATDQKTREDALKAQEEREKKMKLAAAQTPPNPNAPGAVKPGGPGGPAPIGVPMKPDDKNNPNKDKPGAKTDTPNPPGSSAPAGRDGSNGSNGRDGVDGKDGKDGSTLVVGGNGQAPTQGGSQQGGQAGSSVSPPNNGASKETSALSTDFAGEALNLLDLGQAEAIWSNTCQVTPTTANEPAANQQGVKVQFTVFKNGHYQRLRQLHQGSDCSIPLEAPDWKEGDLKVVSRESGSTADSITYKVDLTYSAIGAPAQPQNGSTAQTTQQKPTIQTLIRIERSSNTLFLAKDPAAGGARPTTVDGGDKLKHN